MCRPLSVFLLAFFQLSLSFAQKQAEAPADSDLERALANLDHNEFAKRDEATLTLWKIGEAALPHLRKLAASSIDPEAAHRASQLATRIEFGLEPGSPRAILDFLDSYVTSPPESRYGILLRHLRGGLDPSATEALIRFECRTDPSMKNRALSELVRTFYIRILKGETKAKTRVAWESALNFLEGDIRHGNPAQAIEHLLAAQGETPPFASSPPPANARVPRSEILNVLSKNGIQATLEFLQDSVAAGDHRSASLRRLMLFEFIAGDPDKVIKNLASEYVRERRPHLATLLIYLHRLNGDLDIAEKYSKDFPETDAALATFLDLGDWPSFRSAWLAGQHPNLNPVESLGIEAALAQLVDDVGARATALSKLAALTPSAYPERLQQLENLVLLGELKIALDVVDLNLSTDPEFGIQALYARWKIAILVAGGKPEAAITFATPLVEAQPWRSSQLTSEFADLLISQNRKLTKSLTEIRRVPTTSIGSYIATLKKAGSKRLEVFNTIANYRTTIPRQRRFAEGHFPDAPNGHAAMWWFFLSKKFPADTYQRRLERLAKRLAAFPGSVAPEEVNSAAPEVIADDLDAIFQLRVWLSNRCITKPSLREINDIWLSMAIPFARSGSGLDPLIDDLSAATDLSSTSKLELASYFLRNRSPENAAAMINKMGNAADTPILAAALARIETDPNKATELFQRAHLLPLEDPGSRASPLDFLTLQGDVVEANRSRHILAALWAPTADGFARSLPNKPTNKLESQRRWLQHFTAQTFRPSTDSPLQLGSQSWDVER